MHDFGFDRKANKLRDWAIDEAGVSFCVCADTATFFQIRAFLLRRGVSASPAPFPESDSDRWTHCLSLSFVPEDLSDFLQLLSTVIVLQGLPPEVDDAIALDFYKIPRPDLQPDEWPNTEIGELVWRMKYWTNDPVSQATSQEHLADALADVVARHPSYRESRIVSVPGHDAAVVGRSELLAIGVANRLGTSLAKTRARSLLRPAAKNRSEQVDFRGEFVIEPDAIRGQPVLIIDDVFGRGTTMKAVAHEARKAGSPRVHGLVAARTIR
jgi:hypothetical protein